MKKILFILSILSIVLFASCNKDSNPKPSPPVASDTLGVGWKKINFIDTSFISVIFFINNTGFAASSNIYKSSDGGENWSQLTSASGLTQNLFFSMGMGNERNAMFVTTYVPLVETQNSGARFTAKAIPDNFLTDVFFIDSTIAYAAGNSFWKTIDGGNDWIKLYDFPPSGRWNSLFFTDEQTGWSLTQEGLYKTLNGGTDWQLVNTDTIDLSEGGDVFFINFNTGYISHPHSIEKTEDGGASWTKVFTCTSNAYHDLHFISESLGYITDGRCIFKTTDGGKTWVKVVAMASNIISDLHFTDANHGWACGQRGTILKFNQ